MGDQLGALPQGTTGADATVTQKTAGLIGGLLGALIPLHLNVNSLGLHVGLLNKSCEHVLNE